MSRKKWIALLAVALLVFVPACDLSTILPAATATPPPPTVPLDTQVADIVATTQAAQTQVANDATATLESQAQVASAVAATLAAIVTDTPQFTFTPSITSTPSFTPSPTFTLTVAVPMVSVSSQTNCRSGPGTAYEVLGVVNVGQTAQVVARNPSTGYWIIKLPSNPAITCWLWGQYATVVGDSLGLPVATQPSTPTPQFTATPQASFLVVYTSIEDCGGGLYGIKFQISNNGNLTWESNRVLLTDTVTTETVTISRDTFTNYAESGCALLSEDDNLEPGEVGHTSSSALSANPAGHSMTATIRVCSQEALAGTCLEKTITFTP